jgi:hypothetical protein
LGSWVKNRQKAGQPVTDAMIQEQLKHFSTTVGGPDSQRQATSSWLEKFKVKNGLGSKSRKSSVAEESDSGNVLDSPAQGTTPSISPTSPQNKRDHSPSRLSMAIDDRHKDHKRVKSESPDSQDPSPISQHKPFASISSAFTNVAPSPQQHTHSSSYSLSPIRPHSPFFSSNPYTPDQPIPHGPTSATGSFRPRSQTFPLSTAAIDPSPVTSYASPPSSSDTATTKFFSNMKTDIADSPSEHSQLLTTSPIVTSRSTTSKQSSVVDPLSPNFGVPVSSEGIMLPPTSALLSASSAAGPSVVETQRALQVVLDFFQHQSLGEPEEYIMMGKLMEKLRLQHQTAVSGDAVFSMSAAAYAIGRSAAE